jgi:oligosaccharyltransferase complex subunit beta
VVPFRHNEYPRFITGAWPFYSGSLSVTAAFLLFCGIWVFTADGPASKVSKGKKVE